MKKVGKLDLSKGFTIVELLIVIVIIGILAALVIIAYNGIQNRASDTAVQADLRNFAQKIEAYNADKGVYPAMSSSDLASLEYKVTRGAYGTAGNGQYGNGYNIGYCVNSTTAQWTLYAISSSGNGHRVGSNFRLQQITPITGGGYAVCNLVGVSSTNPIWGRDANSNTWASWLN